MQERAWLRFFRYGEPETEAAIQTGILVESARVEARAAILVIMLALVFGVLLGFSDARFTNVALFAAIITAFLLLDAQMRRSAAKRLGAAGEDRPE